MVVPLRRYACTQARGVTLAPRLVALRLHPGFWRYARGIMPAPNLVPLRLHPCQILKKKKVEGYPPGMSRAPCVCAQTICKHAHFRLHVWY